MEVKEEDFVPGAKGREEEEDDREDNSSSSSSEENSSASTPQDGLMVESGGTTGSGRFSFDALICQLGEFGLYQRLIFFLLWIPAAASSVGIYASIFLEFTPDHRCVAPDACDPNPAWLGNLADPECTLPIFRNESTCEVDAGEAVACPEVLFDDSLFQNTVVTEFLGVCSRAYLKSLSSTSYMSGMLVGSFFFGWISDMFGRRFCFSATVLFLAGGSILAAASSSYPMYIVSRFISSMGGIGLFITAFVLSMEFIGPNYRTLCGIAIEIPFALGELYLVLLAYFVREWRQLQLLIGIPFLGFFLYLIKLPESIRWCLTKGKVEKARETLKQLAKMNGAKPPTDQLMETFGDTRLPAGKFRKDQRVWHYNAT